MRLIIVANWLVSLACLCAKRPELVEAQRLAARYFFTQFWAEFTIEVLQDFSFEDAQYHRALLLKYEAE